MTAAKRPTATITDLELEQAAHLTLPDAATALGIGSTATVRLLYEKRGIPRVERRPGELAEYHTRAEYRTNGKYKLSTDADSNAVPGIRNGKRVKEFWDTMDANMANRIGLNHVCRQFGTEHCLKYCELEIALPDCNLLCHKCEFEQRCPCSLCGWLARQEE